MLLTKNEEDYLKALFHLTVESVERKAGTNQLAEYLSLSPASVNGMLKKLRDKSLVDYEKYGKLELTAKGRSVALRLIRKHRLWETFLYQHLNFSWDEVHEVAEQLEHIQSVKLIQELDRYLGFPRTDPHGDPIPTADGKYEPQPKQTLADLSPGVVCRLIAVKDRSAAFLKYVSQVGLALSSQIIVTAVHDFDHSVQIAVDDKAVNVSRKFAEHIFVEVVS